jgi:hypothetical protein
MKRATNSILKIAALGAVVSFGTVSCADDSAPNRRGLERAPLVGRGAQDNADKREIEPQKRDLPTGSGGEFPGQSLAPTPSGDQPVVFLDDVGIVPASTPASAPTTTAEAAGTQPAATATAATATAATAATATSETSPASATSTNQPAKPALVEDPKAFDHPGQPMLVPNTGLSIAPDWGRPQVLTNYPHRPWPNTATTYESGQAWHNPYYFQPLFTYSNNPADWAKDQGKSDVHELVEIPYFFGETLALPVLMVINPPFNQRTTRNKSDYPVYLNALTDSGPVVPAPQPGQIHFDYPPAITHAPPRAQMEPDTTPAPATQP